MANLHMQSFLPTVPRLYGSANYVVSQSELPFRFNGDMVTLTVPNNIAETVRPEYLVCRLRSPGMLRSPAARAHLYDVLRLRLSLDGVIVFEIGLKLLADMKEPVIVGSDLYIDLQAGTFFAEVLPLHMLTQQTVQYQFTGGASRFTEARLGCQLTFNQSPIPLNSFDVQLVDTLRLTQVGHHTIQVSLTNNTAVKGFFLNCRDVQDLQELELVLLGQRRMFYTAYQLQRYCVRISETCLYVGFNPAYRYDNRDRSSYEGALHIRNQPEGSVQLRLSFASMQDVVTISLLKYNAVSRRNSMSYLSYGVEGEEDRRYQVMDYEQYRRLVYRPFVPAAELAPVARPSPYFATTAEPRWIAEEERRICCISLEPIAEGNQYIRCVACPNLFLKEPLLKWVSGGMGHCGVCPTCRTPFFFPLQTYLHLPESAADAPGESEDAEGNRIHIS